MKHYLAQFRGFRIPGRKTLPVNFTQRADESVAVLAADFTILVAMAMVETWFAHAALPLPQPIAQTVPKRSGWQWLSACVTHPASLPGFRTQLPPRPSVCKPLKRKTRQRRSWSQTARLTPLAHKVVAAFVDSIV